MNTEDAKTLAESALDTLGKDRTLEASSSTASTPPISWGPASAEFRTGQGDVQGTLRFTPSRSCTPRDQGAQTRQFWRIVADGIVLLTVTVVGEQHERAAVTQVPDLVGEGGTFVA